MRHRALIFEDAICFQLVDYTAPVTPSWPRISRCQEIRLRCQELLVSASWRELLLLLHFVASKLAGKKERRFYFGRNCVFFLDPYFSRG